MPESENRAAFLFAAVVLLVMPIVFVLGLASLMLVMRAAGLFEMGRLMVAISLVWGLFVTTVVLLVARRVIGRSARF